jgi:hypothetical protein
VRGRPRPPAQRGTGSRLGSGGRPVPTLEEIGDGSAYVTFAGISHCLRVLALEVSDLRRQVTHLSESLSAAGAFIDAALNPKAVTA